MNSLSSAKRLMVFVVGSIWVGMISTGAEAFEPVVSFDPTLGEFPESITRDNDGNLIWSMGDTIWTRTSEGELRDIGSLPIAAFALGVKVGPDECVYTVSTSLSDVPGAFVWRICPDEEIEQLAALDQQGGANDLVIDRNGNVYITDPFLGRIWKMDGDGNIAIWLEHPLLQGNPDDPALVFHSLGADGIVFDRKHTGILVGNLDYGSILHIDFEDDGTAGAVTTVVADPLLVGADGLLWDRWGNLLVAVNAQDSVAAVSPCGEIKIIAEGGVLDGPSSLVFGGHGDAATLYVTNSAFSRAFGFVPGDPNPALLQTKWWKNRSCRRHPHCPRRP